MSTMLPEDQIRLYAKQLKIPTFADYAQLLRQTDPSAGFGDLLLTLMQAESCTRQENQTKQRLKAAAFPYQKTMDEFDISQLNPAVSPVFLREFAHCQLIQAKQNVIPCPVQKCGNVVHRVVRGAGQLFSRKIGAHLEQCRSSDFGRTALSQL